MTVQTTTTVLIRKLQGSQLAILDVLSNVRSVSFFGHMLLAFLREDIVFCGCFHVHPLEG